MYAFIFLRIGQKETKISEKNKRERKKRTVCKYKNVLTSDNLMKICTL